MELFILRLELVERRKSTLYRTLEAPLKSLMPSAKSLFLRRLYDLAEKHPALSDAKLSDLLRRLYGAELSRRSVAQYRSELGI